MNALSKRLTASCAIYLFFTTASAQSPTDTSMIFKSSELALHDFQVGKLKVTIKKFDTHHWGAGFVVHAENTSSGFIAFSHEDLMAVGPDGSQVNATILFDKTIVTPTRIRIAPSAHVDISCIFNKNLKLPIKLYLGEEFLGVIKE